jgi:hypothetical protein
LIANASANAPNSQYCSRERQRHLEQVQVRERQVARQRAVLEEQVEDAHQHQQRADAVYRKNLMAA